MREHYRSVHHTIVDDLEGGIRTRGRTEREWGQREREGKRGREREREGERECVRGWVTLSALRSLSRLWPRRMVSEATRLSILCCTCSRVVVTETKSSGLSPLNL